MSDALSKYNEIKRKTGAVVPKQFAKDFELVAEHYKFREHGEYEEAKELARIDLKGAMECYGAIANSLRSTGEAYGINERIRARIAAEAKEAA